MGLLSGVFKQQDCTPIARTSRVESREARRLRMFCKAMEAHGMPYQYETDDMGDFILVGFGSDEEGAVSVVIAVRFWPGEKEDDSIVDMTAALEPNVSPSVRENTLRWINDFNQVKNWIRLFITDCDELWSSTAIIVTENTSGEPLFRIFDEMVDELSSAHLVLAAVLEGREV